MDLQTSQADACSPGAILLPRQDELRFVDSLGGGLTSCWADTAVWKQCWEVRSQQRMWPSLDPETSTRWSCTKACTHGPIFGWRSLTSQNCAVHRCLHAQPSLRMVMHHKADLTPCKCTSSISLLRGTTIVCPDIMSRQASLCE